MDIQAEVNRRTAERIGNILLGRIALEVENDALKLRVKQLESTFLEGGTDSKPKRAEI